MVSALVVGDIHVGPEQREMQVVEAPIDGHTVKVPVSAINGKREGQGVWSDELVEQHKEGALRVLHHLNVLPGPPLPPSDNQRVYDTFAWTRAEAAGLFHPTVKVGDIVQVGQPIGCMTDYFGIERQRLEASTYGEIVFLVTSLAMNVGDPLLAIGH